MGHAPRRPPHPGGSPGGARPGGLMKVERSCGEELINGDGGGVRSIRGINHHVLVGVATPGGEEVGEKGENRTSFRLKKK